MKQFDIDITIFFIIGLLVTCAGFLGFLTPIFLLTSFLAIVCVFINFVGSYFVKLPSLTTVETKLVTLLLIIWAVHFLQVLVPETGFDALWYHLPILKEISIAQKLVYIPDLYQSVNPLFSDLYFLAGFAVLGSIGTKVIAYIFSILLVTATYYLSRIYVDKKYALIVVASVSVFQVVSWQAASFYVDIAKALFEVSGLYFLLSGIGVTNKKNIKKSVLGVLFFSGSLASKLFSIVLAPLVLLLVYQNKRSERQFLINTFLLFLVPTLYYSFSFFYTGDFFFSFTQHLTKLAEIGGEQNIVTYILVKSLTLPQSVYFFVTSRDYVYPLLPLFFIPIVLKFTKILKDKKIFILLVFSSYQWLVWWFIPPLSTRYALSGFITFLILGIATVCRYFLKNQRQEKVFITGLALIILLQFLPRILVANRSLQYILTPQTQREYLQQFYDGSIDEKINNWYY